MLSIILVLAIKFELDVIVIFPIEVPSKTGADNICVADMENLILLISSFFIAIIGCSNLDVLSSKFESTDLLIVKSSKFSVFHFSNSLLIHS